MARKLSPTLAVVVENLELNQPVVVTLDMLRQIAAGNDLGTDPKIIAARLRQQGWLLPTGSRGVYEFAPGSHAGPYGHAAPTLPLRAALAGTPGLAAGLALSTAAWALGAADRAPGRIDVAVPTGARVPVSLARSAAVTSFTSVIGYVDAKSVPCHRPETVLVHMADAPSAPRSWGTVMEWFADLAADADADLLHRELESRSRATQVRVGYLLSGVRPDLARPLTSRVGDPVRFGRRTGQLRRHSNAWRVLDYALPLDPSSLDPVS